ncbi:MAG: Gfo/Idh/MocA family protein [Kiritimatiellia bacterium]
MSDSRDGQSFKPQFTKTKPVVAPGEFNFAAAYFDHGHIHGQIEGLIQAGGILKYIYDPNPERIAGVVKNHPEAKLVSRFEDILDDHSLHMVTSAAIPCDRGPIGIQVMESGKDYFTDKSPFTTLEQLAQAREVVQRTGRKYMVYYCERLGSESTYYAGEIIRQGAIGRVLQVLNLAPHNLNAPSRPQWFFQKEKYGGILTDIGSHQFEQFLHFTQATDMEVVAARVENLANPEFPGLEDFGEALLKAPDGASCYCRVDWFNPKGSKTWGDGRTFVLGTKGSIEIRKNHDLARQTGGNILFLVDEHGEQEIHCKGQVGYPYFPALILDVLNRTENAMTQAQAFKAAEVSMKAQAIADAQRQS